MMAVLPEFRRRGLGTALLRRCLIYFREQGWRDAVLDTEVSRPEAIRLYLANGFVPAPEIEEDVANWRAVLARAMGEGTPDLAVVSTKHVRRSSLLPTETLLQEEVVQPPFVQHPARDAARLVADADIESARPAARIAPPESWSSAKCCQRTFLAGLRRDRSPRIHKSETAAREKALVGRDAAALGHRHAQAARRRGVGFLEEDVSLVAREVLVHLAPDSAGRT